MSCTLSTLPGRPAAAATLLGVLLAMSSCGADPVTLEPGGGPAPSTSTPSTSTPPEPDAPAGAAPAADLTVVVDDGAGTSAAYTLTCEPVGGDVPDPQGACAALAGAGTEAFAPVLADQMCTMVFGGPQTATVSGTFDGRPVAATFARTDGCQIARWDALSALLGSVDAGS